MSPAASKSKSKDKRAGKESNKASSKPSGNGNNTAGGGAIPTSGYNPLLGTFHTLETAPVSSVPPLYVNGRFRNIDDTDDHGGTGIDYDAISNNDSLSGESEEHRDKTSHLNLRHDVIPGADNDKREKIRQKNEKKHQRQKERRAQELHERCSGYLMSRKLEALAQQLVTMGFSSERATMALILNEGKVEESVNWLFEGGEETNEQKEQHNLDAGGGNLKLDISEELARIAEMEIKFKCSKMDIERAVVACEGDLERAAESLKVQKPDPPSSTPKPEETGDPPTSSINNNTNIKTASSVPVSQNSLTSSSSSLSRQQQMKPSSYNTIQQKRDDKDFNYAKVAVVTAGLSVESGSKNTLKKIQQPPKSTEWVKPQAVVVPSDKRWQGSGSNPPSVNFSLTSSLQAPSKIENRYLSVGTELKNIQLGSVREPVIMMQRPQSSTNTKLVPATSMVQQQQMNNNSLEAMKSNGLGPHIPPPPPLTNNHQLYNQLHYQQQQQQQYHFLDPAGTSSSSSRVVNPSWNRSGTSPPLAAASSLGLFSGLGSNGSSGSSSPVDWNAGGSMLHLDYANIDWSLDRGPTSSRSSGMWHHHHHHHEGVNVNSFMMSDSQGFESYSNSQGMRLKSATMKRPIPTDGGSHEWTSPFEEKDIFSLPRQFVSSPSL